MHTALLPLVDILLVALTISSSFKYVQQDEDSIYLYHQKADSIINFNMMIPAK